jgi:hypothetical protein
MNGMFGIDDFVMGYIFVVGYTFVMGYTHR